MLTRAVGQTIIAFIIALALLSLGLNAPFTKDQEPQSAQWIIDIVQHRHWMLPYDYYGYVERKPPLFYWLSALTVEATGGHVNETLSRIPSLLAAAALAAEVMLWVSAAFDDLTGWLAFLFLLGMYGFASRAALALTDMVMTALMLTGYYLLQPLLEGCTSRRRPVAIGIVLGLGILTKGPIVLVLVAVAAAIYSLMTRANPLRMLTAPWPWTVFVVACGIAALWYVPAFVEGRKSDLVGVFVQENFGHFLPAAMGGTGEASRPFYYIAIRLLGSTLPLCLLLPAAIVTLPRMNDRAYRAIAYQYAMVLAVLLIFSLASAKRDDYILPAIPPLAIIIASLFSPVLADPPMKFARSMRNASSAIIALTAGAGTIMIVLLIVARQHISVNVLNLQSADASFAAIFIQGVAHHEALFLCPLAAIVTGAIFCMSGLWSEDDSHVAGGLAIIALALTLVWTGLLKPREAASRSLRVFASQVHNRIGSAAVYVPWQDPEFAYYYGFGVPPLPHGLARNGPPTGTPIYFVARPNQLFVLAPVVREHLIPILRSDVAGGGGAPELYRLSPPAG
ncbi:MAG TPA: glycosyltransferase family 39 protein [Candidatus Binataceae bacterium]|nr:glycosyltransferase family 39 protein [Candidatus Binataceae bacterium]